MRRILSACLLQTMRFDTTSGANPKQEFEFFCEKMKKKNVKYEIEDMQEEKDGSLVVKLKKQYNSYATNGYLE